MVVLGGVIGGLLGFIIVLVIAEWQWVDWFGHHDALEGVLMVLFVGGGAFVGSRLMPPIRGRGHSPA
jgi:H+/Cl- antiporter ClcA